MENIVSLNLRKRSSYVTASLDQEFARVGHHLCDKIWHLKHHYLFLFFFSFLFFFFPKHLVISGLLAGLKTGKLETKICYSSSMVDLQWNQSWISLKTNSVSVPHTKKSYYPSASNLARCAMPRETFMQMEAAFLVWSWKCWSILHA